MHVMIELLGRVQKDKNDGLYYIKIANVKVVGRSLSPAFHAEVQDSSGKFVLEYDTSKIQQTDERDEKPARKKKRHRILERYSDSYGVVGQDICIGTFILQ